MRIVVIGLAAAGLLPVSAATAQAQHGFDAAGERALGMAGAFVAVADDATAVYWNPAGLANGQPVGATIGWTRLQSGNQASAPHPGPLRRTTRFTSLGTWPLGISYGRVTTSRLTDDENGDPAVRTAETSHIGVTLVQSVVTGLVVGTTLKYERGGGDFASVDAATAEEALERASSRERDTTGAFDLDVSVMADMDRVRVGVTVRNLRAPTLGGHAGTAVLQERQTRLGIGVFPVAGLTLAMDLDLSAADLAGDARRILALGAEVRLGSRLEVRGGRRRDLEGPADAVNAVGASLAVRSGLWLDGHYAHGRNGDDREVGVALRAGF